MHFRITGDTDVAAGIAPIVIDLSGPTRQHFLSKSYGMGLLGIGIVLMCQDPELSLKRRIRHSKKESKLYMDIMLDLPTMKVASPEDRKRIVAQRLFDEVPKVLSGYKIPDFDKEVFAADLRQWITSTGWK
jgi:vacuolar-type H+-ATPase subunit F/Vma7